MYETNCLLWGCKKLKQPAQGGHGRSIHSCVHSQVGCGNEWPGLVGDARARGRWGWNWLIFKVFSNAFNISRCWTLNRLRTATAQGPLRHRAKGGGRDCSACCPSTVRPPRSSDLPCLPWLDLSLRSPGPPKGGGPPGPAAPAGRASGSSRDSARRPLAPAAGRLFIAWPGYALTSRSAPPPCVSVRRT